MSNESYPERIVRSTPLAIAAGVVDVTAFFSLIFSRSVRNWVESHPLILTVGGLFIILSLLLLTNFLARSRQKLQVNLLNATNEIADLKTRLHPTPRDKEKFAQILEAFPTSSGSIAFLEGSFIGKQWRDQQVEQIHTFPHAWRHEFFDDETAQEAFDAFRQSLLELSNWLGGEGFPHDHEDDVSTLPAPHEFAGGHDEFKKVRQQGLDLADAVVVRRREFEQVGRKRGL